MAKKTNPKKIPRSQKDVDDAYRLGVYRGVEVMVVIWILSLYDCGADDDFVTRSSYKVASYIESMHMNMVNVYDVKKALEAEKGVRFDELLKHFGYKRKI